MISVITLSVFVASAVASNRVASRRGVDPVFWTVMGAALGPLAIPFPLFAGTWVGR